MGIFGAVATVGNHDLWHANLIRWSRGFGVDDRPRLVHALPLTPWQGLGVLAPWAAGALILGGLVLRLRDT
jgi:ABC-2 type transport system permease protein